MHANDQNTDGIKPAPLVVVINDDQDQIALVSRLLQVQGMTARGFGSVGAALESLSPDNPPALFITDLCMPEVDGWQFCRLARSPEYAAFNNIPILVISATFAGETPERIAAELKADAFLPVPFDTKDFIRQVRSLLDGRQVRRPNRVLVVEDSRSMSNALRRSFERNGYLVETALSLQEARAALHNHAFTVAVIDYHLPDGQGDVVLDICRHDHPDCVCLMITTDPNPDLALAWMKQGAAAYLRKPFKSEYLLELCDRARRERALLRVQELLNTRTRALLESAENLRRSEERLRLTIEATHDGIWEWNVANGQASFSPHYYTMLEYAPDEFPSSYNAWRDLLHPDDRGRPESEVLEHIRHGTGFAIETRMRTKSGGWRWILGRGMVVSRDEAGRPVRLVGTHTDITERKLAEERLQQALNEKETLLRELYHRTKNNMQVISSMLAIQANRSADAAVAQSFREMENRIHSMALVHQKLYQAGDLSRLDLRGYIEELARDILGGYNTAAGQIELRMDIVSVAVLIDIAIPCGLIINELISNSAKYAFPPGHRGQINIEIGMPDPQTMELCFADNGTGLPADFDVRRPATLGMQIIHTLAEHQLRGRIIFENRDGLHCRIRFPAHANSS